MEHYFLIGWKYNWNFKLFFSLVYAEAKRISQGQFQVQEFSDHSMEFALENLGRR